MENLGDKRPETGATHVSARSGLSATTPHSSFSGMSEKSAYKRKKESEANRIRILPKRVHVIRRMENLNNRLDEESAKEFLDLWSSSFPRSKPRIHPKLLEACEKIKDTSYKKVISNHTNLNLFIYLFS